MVQLGQGELRNNGGAIYSQTTSGFTGGTNFGNDGTVDGSGEYLFSGTTSTQGTVAGASAATPIVFDDTSPTGGQIFDTQLGTITNTLKAPVTAPDPSSCTATPPTSTTSTTSSTTTTVPTSTTRDLDHVVHHDDHHVSDHDHVNHVDHHDDVTDLDHAATRSSPARRRRAWHPARRRPARPARRPGLPAWGLSPGRAPRAEATYVAGLLLVVIGCLAYAIGREMPDKR